MLEYDVSLSGTELRAAKPNFHRGCFAPALESRGANLRPRKLDEHLNRDVARARRVALLSCASSRPPRPDGVPAEKSFGGAERATLTQYRHPLSYVSAITKIFGKVQKLVPHFGRRELYSEWGRSPEIFGKIQKLVPHFGRSELYSEWGRSPVGEEGDNNSHVRGR